MSAQPTLNPCEFCGEPSIGEVEIRPAVYESAEGVRTLKKRAVKVWACSEHRRSVREDRGWQERQAAIRREAREDLEQRTEEAKLFDPGPSRRRAA